MPVGAARFRAARSVHAHLPGPRLVDQLLVRRTVNRGDGRVLGLGRRGVREEATRATAFTAKPTRRRVDKIAVAVLTGFVEFAGHLGVKKLARLPEHASRKVAATKPLTGHQKGGRM